MQRTRVRMRAIPGSWWVTLANLTTAVLVAAVTAVLALVVEDALPASGGRQYHGQRWAALAVAVMLLFAAIVWRGAVYRRTGTLFYVRLLDESSKDWHRQALQQASRHRMSLRSVVRHVDIPGREHNGVANLIDVRNDITVALETAINGDRDDTAYALAPNLPWPVALAVGAELPIVNRLRLIELMGPAGRSATAELAFPLPLPEAPPGLARQNLAEDHGTLPGHEPQRGRIGLLLACAPSAQGKAPTDVFAGFGVSEYHRIRPAWINTDLAELTPGCFSGQQLATIAQALPELVHDIKQTAGARDLVVVAYLPKIVTVALGWALAQRGCRFFAGTHLIHYHQETNRVFRPIPIRVHPSQPVTPPPPFFSTRTPAGE